MYSASLSILFFRHTLSLDLVTGIDSVKRPVRFGIWMGNDPLAIGEVWKSYGLAAAGDRLLG